MEQKKNLCAQIPLSLHDRVTEAREQSGLTTAQYITQLLTEYYEMKENGGEMTMATNSRTMAFQIPEDWRVLSTGQTRHNKKTVVLAAENWCALNRK